MKHKTFGLALALVLFTCCVAVGCHEETIADLDPDPQEPRGFGGDMQKPVKIIIPKIGGDADIQPVDMDKYGNIEDSSQDVGVVWYEKGASPGWDYNAILAAHHDFDGMPGVFMDLEKLEIGDVVEIRYKDGSIGRFVVKSTNTYHGENVPDSVMANSGPTRTTLITGSGSRLSSSSGRYSHYLVVTLAATEHIGVDGREL
ncbi:MAG: class F sortase [Peptococcaceae bacterium]|nr:class F sortase [Peptococcaceae bacterium]